MPLSAELCAQLSGSFALACLCSLPPTSRLPLPLLHSPLPADIKQLRKLSSIGLSNWPTSSTKKHSHAYDEHKKQLPKTSYPLLSLPIPFPTFLYCCHAVKVLRLPCALWTSHSARSCCSKVNNKHRYLSPRFPSPPPSHVPPLPLPPALSPVLSQSLRLAALATVAMQSGGTASQKLSASFCPATSYTRISCPLPPPLCQPSALLACSL